MTPLHLRLGAAWYPEQWDIRVLQEDIRLMRELGLNTVRVGEFAWSVFEPMEGHFQTAWLEEALDLAHGAGLQAVVCTPTACPPAWLLKKHPEIGYQEADGYRHKHGARQHGCYNNPVFREHGRLITEVVAKTFAGHPALVAWQTDNEFRGHQKVCVCEACQVGWHHWLEARYGTIAALNEAWGTAVWSQSYQTFADVPPVHRLCYYAHNFSLLLNYRRFMTDSVVGFQREQVDILRRHSGAPITHNSEHSVDEWELTRDLDFASADIYLAPEKPWEIHHRFDALRGLKPWRRFWTMETGAEGRLFDQMYPPGWLACFAFLNFVSGGEGLSYWPWRQHRTGAEIGHSAFIYASGKPTTGWEQGLRVAETREKLQPILHDYSPARAEVALIESDLNGYYFFSDLAAGLEANFSYRDKMSAEHSTLLQCGVWRDVLSDRAPLDGYRIIFSPYLPCLSPEFLAAIKQHLARGGVWVAGPYTGYRGVDHTVPTNAILGDLEALLGFETKFFSPIPAMKVSLSHGAETKATMCATVFAPRPDDEVLGIYDEGPFAGEAWGLAFSNGGGRVYLLGSEITSEARASLYAHILDREGVARHPLPPRVSLCPQSATDGREAWALSNWDEVSHTVTLPRPGRDLISGGEVSGSVSLAPFTSAFVEFAR